MGKKKTKRLRDREEFVEVARAVKLGVTVPALESRLVYSLSATGVIRQCMTFRRGEHTHSSGWQHKAQDVDIKSFRLYHLQEGFNVLVHENPIRVNYDRPGRVHRSHMPLTKEELLLFEKVLVLCLEGLSPKVIDEQLGLDPPQAAKIIREVERLGR